MIEALILQRLKEQGQSVVLAPSGNLSVKQEVAIEGDALAVTGIIGERRGTGLASAGSVRGTLSEDLERRLQIASQAMASEIQQVSRISKLGDIPEIFPKETTKKFVEVNTGEVIYVLKYQKDLYYQKEI
jgi:hypothetical protein